MQPVTHNQPTKDTATAMIQRFCCLLILVHASLFAQNYLDLARFSYAVTPNNNFVNSEEAVSIREWGLQLDFPIVLNEKTIFLTGIVGSSFRIKLDPALPYNTEMYSLGLKFGFNQQYANNWTGTYLALPKIASDFVNGFSSGYQFGLVSVFTKTRTDKLKYSFGLYGNTEEFGFIVVPLLGGYYQSPNNRFQANVLLPVSMDLNYLLGKKTSVGMNFDGLGGTFALDDPTFSNSYVNRASNELFAYFQLALTPATLLRIKTGYAFFRGYKLYENKEKVALSLTGIYLGDNRPLLNTELKDGFIFKADFIYRFHFKKKDE